MTICEHCGNETNQPHDHDGEVWCQPCHVHGIAYDQGKAELDTWSERWAAKGFGTLTRCELLRWMLEDLTHA